MDFLLNVSKSYKALRSKCSVFTKIPILGNEPKNTEQHSDLDMLNILRQLIRANAHFGVFINIILNAAINYAKRSVRFLKEPTACIYSHFKWYNYEEIGIITECMTYIDGTWLSNQEKSGFDLCPLLAVSFLQGEY